MCFMFIPLLEPSIDGVTEHFNAQKKKREMNKQL